jgi:coenzyme F420-reducing hydrogenase delta subunit
MKSLYVLLIALAAIAAGFGIGRYTCSQCCATTPATNMTGGGFATMTVNPANSIMRLQKCSNKLNPSYYIYVLNYAADSINLSGMDSLNTKYGASINYSAPNYVLSCTHGLIDSIARSTIVQTSYSLVDSTIYSRMGIIYGMDNTGHAQSFRADDVISVQSPAMI